MVTIDRYLAKDDDSGTKYDRVYLVYPSMCSIAYLRPMKFEKLAKTGDSHKYMGTVEATFVCHNEKAHGKVKKCATD